MNENTNPSVVNPNRMQSLINEAIKELEELNPEIEYLEECVQKLAQLKERKHKLNSLIINLKSLTTINTDVELKNNVHESNGNYKTKDVQNINVNKISMDFKNERKVFIPEVALNDAKPYLRTKNNINYEIYKAVVFNTGEASTEDIKHYLIKNKIKQPKSGKGFENVPLKEISSRANYLVRKQLLISYSPGLFSTIFGWQETE